MLEAKGVKWKDDASLPTFARFHPILPRSHRFRPFRLASAIIDFRNYSDFELTNAADSAIFPYRQLKSREIIHCGISP